MKYKLFGPLVALLESIIKLFPTYKERVDEEYFDLEREYHDELSKPPIERDYNKLRRLYDGLRLIRKRRRP